jgi:Flp pilus assembly protein TadD
MNNPELLLRSRSVDMDLLRHLAFTLARCGRRVDALRHATRACELRPDDPCTWSDQGCIHALFGDLPAAVSRFTASIDVDLDFAVGWHNLGVALARLGDSRAAVRAYRNALMLDERCAPTWFALGELLADVGLTERALQLFERAERLAAPHAHSFTIHAALRTHGDFPCALPPPDS